VQGRFASLALTRPPQTPEAGVVVTLPWGKFTTHVAGDGAWARMRIFVPRRYRRSQLVATLATSAWFPVDDDVPDIRCLGVMIAEEEVGGDKTFVFGARAMKVPHLRKIECRIAARMRCLRARLAVRHHASAALAALTRKHRP
jgi:hypothetical protein